jgi:hypothetical protein
MSVIDKLAWATGNRDEEANIELAKQIAKKNDKDAVAELVANLTAKKAAIRSDCIKALYELGELKPELIAPYEKDFLKLLTSKENRLQWGAMTALSCICKVSPKTIYKSLSVIMDAANKGTVITNDRAVRILITLTAQKEYAANTFTLLIDKLKSCPDNQLPMYAEQSMGIINDKNRAPYIKVLQSRLDDIEKESKRKRVEKVIKKLSK